MKLDVRRQEMKSPKREEVGQERGLTSAAPVLGQVGPTRSDSNFGRKAITPTLSPAGSEDLAVCDSG